MKINWKYTIGEILIVIIGISIAFGLNNWNEGRQDQKLKSQYVNNLIQDVNSEIEKLNTVQSQIQDKISTIRKLRPQLMNPQLRNDSTITKIFKLARLENFDPENSTYQTLINSGDMKLLDNFELRRRIEAHYAVHDIVARDYSRIEKIHERYLGDFFIHKINYAELYRGNVEFLNDPLLLNIFSSLEGAYQLLASSNQKCLDSNQELLHQLEQLQ